MSSYYAKFNDDNYPVALGLFNDGKEEMFSPPEHGGWQPQKFMDALYGEDFDADWGPIGEAQASERWPAAFV